MGHILPDQLWSVTGSRHAVLGSSVATLRWLLTEGLLDELDLLVHPIVVGKGGRLFSDGMDQVPLQLIGSSTFSNGVVHLTYAPAAE